MRATTHVCDTNGVLCRACDLALLDAEMRRVGFHGYEGCPRVDCPTPYYCSEKGDCRAVAP